MDDRTHETDKHYGFRMTETEVRRLQDFNRRECRIAFTLEQIAASFAVA